MDPLDRDLSCRLLCPRERNEKHRMFEEEGVGIIRHLSHSHHQMRLNKKIQIVYDETKHCQACMLPFYDDDNVYQCMQCNFILHELCAYIPRVKQFMLDIHPLILDPVYATTCFKCDKCDRYSCGFRYVCRQGCELEIDTLCASVCEPFDHHSHPHPLFITCGQYTFKKCSICRQSTMQPLNCVKCDFVSCFYCATLPHKAKYEHDEHLLIFSYGKNANAEVYLCEICEVYVNPKYGLYSCNDCGITLHVYCLLGGDPYMKSGQSCRYFGEKIHVLPNTYSTRPICVSCQIRCPYKIKIVTSRGGVFCSLTCYHR